MRLNMKAQVDGIVVLKTLVLEGNSAHEKRNGLFPLRWKAHYLTEMYLACLPLKTIDDSSKIVISADKTSSISKAAYVRQPSFGVSIYHLSRDQIDTLYRIEPHRLQETAVQSYKRKKQEQASGRTPMTPEQGQEYIASLIEHVLIDIAQKADAMPSTIDQIQSATLQIRDMAFSYEKRIDKLSKASPDRRYSAQIFRCLGQNIGEAWRLEMQTKDGVQYREWITTVPEYMDRTDFFKTAKWENGVFQITDNLGEPVITVSMKEDSPVLSGVFLDKRSLHSL